MRAQVRVEITSKALSEIQRFKAGHWFAMTMTFKSITARLASFVAMFVLIVLVVSILSIAGLSYVNTNSQKLIDKWLAGSRILGQIGEEMHEFRIAEDYRALAIQPDYDVEADKLSKVHRDALMQLLDEYKQVLGPEVPAKEFQIFIYNWTIYSNDHDRWVLDDGRGQNTVALFSDDLHKDFVATDNAVRWLVDKSQSIATAQAAQVLDLAHKVMFLVILSVVFAGILAVVIIRQAFSEISLPLKSITAALSSLAAGSLEIEVPHLRRPDEIGQMAAAFEVFRMNAMALADARSAADALARYDSLTGAANRRLFSSMLETVVDGSETTRVPCGIMILDLDRFKSINDVHGHAAGDQVLREVAKRLMAVIGDQGTVARLGGDEFAIILPIPSVERTQIDLLQTTASEMLGTLTEPVGYRGLQLSVGMSLGVSIFPKDGDTTEKILQAADLAMYRVKNSGRGGVQFFDASFDKEHKDRTALENDVRHALTSGIIQPFFQPIVQIADGTVHAFEILARWHDPSKGFIPPDIFIPVLERLGLSKELTSSMLTLACRSARLWDRDVRLAINVTPMEFQNCALPSQLLDILDREGFSPSRLEVEVTETAVLQDIDAARVTMQMLRQHGISTAIDDFGTGYASLHHLKEMRFDRLKIDRSFVEALDEDDMSARIVSCVLQLARSMDIEVVAEGIEDQAAIGKLHAMGCRFGQGFHYSKAVDAKKAGALLIRGFSDELKTQDAPSPLLKAS